MYLHEDLYKGYITKAKKEASSTFPRGNLPSVILSQLWLFLLDDNLVDRTDVLQLRRIGLD